MTYRTDIDGLRAIAILAVVVFHVGVPGFSGGYVGVDVFFVISGFLITSQLTAELETTGRIRLASFYARRFRRLMPALAVVVLTTISLALLLLTPVDNQVSILKSGIATSLFSSNFYFWKTTGSYFDTGTDLLPLLHMWSLSVEEQWYMILPGTLLLAMWLRRDPNNPNSARRVRTTVGVLIACIFLGSLLLNLGVTGKYERAAFFLLPTRAWQFAVGALIAIHPFSRLFGRAVYSGIASAFGLLFVILSVVLYNEATIFPGWAALLPTIGTALVIAGQNESTLFFRILSARSVRYVGKLSYSWYLWHWPFLSFPRILAFGERDFLRDSLFALASLVAAHITYQLIEQPIRERRPIWSRAVKTTNLYGVATSALLIALASAGISYSKRAAESPRFLAAMNAKASILTEYEHCTELFWYSLPVPLPVSECIFGAKVSESPEFMLWGDSHAMALAPAVEGVAASENIRFLLRVRGACPVLPGVPTLDNGGKENSACGEFSEAVLDQMLAMPPASRPHGVFVVGRWPLYLGDSVGKQHPEFTRLASQSGQTLRRMDALRLMEEKMDQIAGKLERLNIRLLIASPFPAMRYSAPECLARHNADYCGSNRSEFDFYTRDVSALLDRVRLNHSNVRIWNPAQTLCNGNSCAPLRDGIVVFGDSNHLTHAGALMLANSLTEPLRWLTSAAP